MIEPIRVAFYVQCPAEHAFAVWTSKTAGWWPSDHTMSGETGVDIVIERRVGGRIFERTAAGDEHDWGEVVLWEPPRRLAYLWHIGASRADATEVEITFSDRGDGSSDVRIEHRGWERLGAGGEARRKQNRQGLEAVVPLFVAACAANQIRERDPK
jgi:uncharacterized protein YndB with AHSA1/START domain